jgi:hypothetical protein
MSLHHLCQRRSDPVGVAAIPPRDLAPLVVPGRGEGGPSAVVPLHRLAVRPFSKTVVGLQDQIDRLVIEGSNPNGDGVGGGFAGLDPHVQGGQRLGPVGQQG